jgi:hypothetical protein
MPKKLQGMKRIFTLIIFLLLLKSFMQSQTCTAVPVITLNPGGVSPVGAFMMVTYNPAKNLYYWNSGGYPSNPVTTYNYSGGGTVAVGMGNQDWRGLWWNSNTNTLEGNCYNSNGIFTVNVDPVNGYALSGSTIVTANQQPGAQSGGQYDATNNQVLYYNGNLGIAKYSRSTGFLVTTVPITGLPAGYGSISPFGFYTGIPGQEYAIFDYTNRRAYYVNYNTGAYVSTVQFPPTAGAPANYGISYANGLFFIYDGTNWVGFRAGIWVSQNGPICQGQSATLIAYGSPSYTWSNGPSTSSIIVSPTVSSSYTVVATATAGCISNYSITLNVYPVMAPTVSVVGPTLICGTGTNVLTASGANTFTWNTGALSASVALSPSVTSIYTVTGTNSVGCTAFQTSTITVSNPSISISGSLNVCEGQSTTLTASGANSYSWSNGSTNASIAITPTASSTYTVIGTNTLGCTNSISPTVTVFSNPTVTIAGSQSLCSGQSITLSASGANSYSWSNGTNAASTVVSPTANTNYTVTGDSNGCTGSNTISVSITASPILTVTGGGSAVCPNSSVNLAVSGADTYSWSVGATGFSVTVNPSVTCTYSVSGTSTLNGCTSNSVKTISVNPSPTLSVTDGTVCPGGSATLIAFGAVSYTWSNGQMTNPIVVSPNTNTVYVVTGSSPAGCTNSVTANVFMSTCIGLKEQSNENGIGIFPNPFRDVINIRFENASEKLSINIYNSTGQIICSRECESSQASIDLRDKCAGIYLISVSQAGRNIFKARMIKE